LVETGGQGGINGVIVQPHRISVPKIKELKES
jgi:hypothetical protein